MTDDFQAVHEFVKVDGSDPGYTYVLAPVLTPDDPDHVGDVISAHEIQKAAWGFMEESRQVGEMHERLLGRGASIVESYILRWPVKFGDRVIKPFTWMVGAKIYDPEIRKKILSGKFRGFSIGGRSRSQELDAE